MRKFEDLTGQKFGRLTVIKRTNKNKQGKIMWLCECECGNIRKNTKDNLKFKMVKSCGCEAQENKITHGLSDHRLYSIYNNMKQRCYNYKHTSYSRYGGKGVIICDEWLGDFMNFYYWANNNGYSDELTIDRIEVNGNYEPSNCRWSTQTEQMNNTTRNTFIEIDGEIKTISEWAKIHKISANVVGKRFSSGWSVNDLFIPIPSKAEKQSGVKGVIWDRSKKRWNVRITENGRQRTIATSQKLEDAIKAKESYMNNKVKEAN